MEALLPPSFPLVSSQNFYRNLEHPFKERFHLLLGWGEPTNPVCVFLCHHYGVLCAAGMVSQILIALH